MDSSYPLPKPVRAIGVPYQGTHAKAFNQKGDSDNWESENAVDLPTPKGTPVYAVADGTIGKQIGSLGQGGRFAGLRLHLVTAGNEFYYAHLSRLVVKAGETVHAGQLLGYSGVANGVPHLHFAAKSGDPRASFGAKSPDTAAQTQDASALAASPDLIAQPPTVTAPAAVPPPTALGTPTGGVDLPGSVNYFDTHQQTASLWQQVAANKTQVSPETQLLLSNAQLSAGV